MELFVPVVIGRSNCFGFGFSTVIFKTALYNDPAFGRESVVMDSRLIVFSLQFICKPVAGFD